MYYILIVVLVGFASVRLLSYYNTGADEDSFIKRFWDNLLIICDALGQAAFVVTGVVIVIMAKIEPIELWGPFFAFLTSNGGGILRDLFRSDKIISCISEGINAEISIIWGLIFSLFLSVTANDPTSNSLEQSVIIITAGAFITRLLAVYLKIPNLRFRAER
jgi:polar amino acid transport system substrate-binding protein